MGAAAIMVIFFHSKAVLPIQLLNKTLIKSGNIGVDIFVFLSGYGCVRSLAKSSDLRGFMRRRFRRILPPYYVAMVAVVALGGWREPVAILAHLIPVTVWQGQSSSFWYVSLALTLYFMIPVIDDLLVRARHPCLAFLGMMAVASFGMPFIINHKEVTIAVMRIPAMILGVGMARLDMLFSDARDRRRITLLFAALFAAAFIVWFFVGKIEIGRFTLLTPYQMVYFRLAVCSAPLTAALGAVFMLLDRVRLGFVNTMLRWVGSYSLEVYLSHILVRRVAQDLLHPDGVSLLIIMLVLACPLALVIDWLAKRALTMTDRFFLKPDV